MSGLPIRTVIIPAAGRGTRLLPATKVTAKELLPVYDRVVLDFAIDEAVNLDAERIVVVISTAKIAIQAYLSGIGLHAAHHNAHNRGGPRQAGPKATFVFQDQPLGLGHAILCCREVTLPGSFAVLLPDDIIVGSSCLAEMATHYTGGHMVAAMLVKPEDACQYGIFRLGGPPRGNSFPVSGMVEKPRPDAAPSSIAAVGRYILDPVIFDALENTPAGKGGELQLTDAITLSSIATPVVGFKFSGTRYDCGNHDGLLGAAIARKAAARPELASGLASSLGSDAPRAVVNTMPHCVKGPGQSSAAPDVKALADTL